MNNEMNEITQNILQNILQNIEKSFSRRRFKPKETQQTGRKLSKTHREKISKSMRSLWKVYSPSQKEYLTINLKEFCVQHKLNYSAMCNINKGKGRQHRGGWRCVKKT